MEPEVPENVSKELERLAEEQLSDAESDSGDRIRRGKDRRQRVLELYGRGEVRTPDDHYHAALVMLYGDDIQHFDLARTFAKRATALGSQRAWSIIAAAWDRSLIARGRPQRYGTQFIRDKGRWTLGNVDTRITDSDRAFYGVPPLWVQQQAVDRLQRREDEI